MRKSLIPIALFALSLASCDTGVKDSYQTMNYQEYNLITDKNNLDQPAQASVGKYEIKYNISKNVMDVKGSDIIINNQKISFESDTMAIKVTYFKTADDGYVEVWGFSKAGKAGTSVRDLNATFPWTYYSKTTDLTTPDFEVGCFQRFNVSYDLDAGYRVQSFWPSPFFKGNSYASEGTSSHSTKNITYLVQMNFVKNLATAYVYNPEFSVNKPSDYPKVIMIDSIPIKFSHSMFALEASNPKTKIRGKVDNKDVMVESPSFKATDFKMNFLSPDMTDVSISYEIDGKKINFNGSSVLKAGS